MEPEGDTVVSTRYPLREAVALLSETRRHVSFEVGAMIAMELCERDIEGYHLDPERIWIDVVGHLIVSKLKTPRGGLDVVLHDLEEALHPAARAAFRQTLESASDGEGRAADLRDRFANFLYPIDRASARDTLARCLDQASRQLKRKSRQSSRPPRSDEHPPDLLGAGPDSIEVVLSGLDDSVFQQMPREVSIQLELGPRPADEAPQRLGRFHIFGEIARGGMAQVLLARDPEDGDKICVVKRMLPGLSLQRSFRNMFTDEARLGLCLDHPHICRTLEFLSVADEPCIKMEWAPGMTLSDLLERAKHTRTTLSVGFALRLGEALASALSYAHDTKGPDGKPLRVVHRDVSPQNVIVQFDGSIKLLDFGVARSAVQTTHSVVGSVKGKFAYMSPEQSLGMPIDERSDVFCLGICLFEALSGLAPDDAVLPVDVGNNTYAFGHYFECTGHQDVIMSGYLGSIGFALPAALGAAVAVDGNRRVVSISGDGGLGQYLADFTTAVKYSLPIVHIVLNNDELAKISREQVGELRPVWQTSLVNPDFAAYADLCGGAGFRVDEGDELDDVLTAALGVTDRPVMVEVKTSPRWV